MLTSGNKTKRYVYQKGFKIDKPMREALEQLSQRLEVKESMIIREAVKQYLEAKVA